PFDEVLAVLLRKREGIEIARRVEADGVEALEPLGCDLLDAIRHDGLEPARVAPELLHDLPRHRARAMRESRRVRREEDALRLDLADADLPERDLHRRSAVKLERDASLARDLRVLLAIARGEKAVDPQLDVLSDRADLVGVPAIRPEEALHPI